MQITKEKILYDFGRLKRKASLCFKYHLYSYSCSFLEMSSKLMYNANVKYYDNEIEELIHKLTSVIIKKQTFLPKKNRIVFYDCFAWDNRGLTEQYMDSLISLNKYEILYICNHKIDNKGTEIKKKLKKANITMYELYTSNNIRKSKELYDVISKFTPESIIIHNEPSDISGLIVFDSLKDTCKRYLINITDHAFWAGTTCFDYFFEWRDYGYNISSSFRKIDEKKLLLLPFYPMINKSIQFQGFPFDFNNKKIIFSGGSIYKIQGSNRFFEIIKYILDTYEDTIFLFLGNGDSSVLKKFIKQNNYNNRFYFFSERKDIYEVMNHCYLYLNTYPISGSLMTQLACSCGKIPLTYNENRNKDNEITELFINKININFVFYDLKTIFLQIDKYMQNSSETKKMEKQIKNLIITKDEFSIQLKNYLLGMKKQNIAQKYDIDVDSNINLFLKQINNNMEKYYICFLKKNLFILIINLKYYYKYFWVKIKKKIGK